MTQYGITQPEPFILGAGNQKYPGGYIGRVVLNGQTVFETLDPIPKFCQQTCVLWCMAHEHAQNNPSEQVPTPPTPIIQVSTPPIFTSPQVDPNTQTTSS